MPPARYNNWVKYRHKASGRNVTHINAHAVASIETAGRPEDLPRTRCAEAQFQGLKELAVDKQDEGQVIVSGDLNIVGGTQSDHNGVVATFSIQS